MPRPKVRITGSLRTSNRCDRRGRFGNAKNGWMTTPSALSTGALSWVGVSSTRSCPPKRRRNKMSKVLVKCNICFKPVVEDQMGAHKVDHAKTHRGIRAVANAKSPRYLNSRYRRRQ